MSKLLLVVVGLTFVFGYNAYLADRDRKLFQRYPICESFTYHPDCK
jgi:hypothetical protein